MDNVTIAEYFELPSKGKIYSQQVNPQFQLRSMTTEEEMRRLSHSDRQYQVLCDIIDDCMVKDIGISAYDMCLGDYQYVLHKLRTITYGSDYAISSICPYCGSISKKTIDLDSLQVFTYDEEFDKLLEVRLPQSGRTVKLKYQTPRDLDEIIQEEKDFMNKNPESKVNITFLLSLKHLVDTVDGQRLDPIKLDLFLRKLSMKDTNVILQYGSKISDKVGVDPVIKNKCSNSKCGVVYSTTFRITGEFFGPSIDL